MSVCKAINDLQVIGEQEAVQEPASIAEGVEEASKELDL